MPWESKIALGLVHLTRTVARTARRKPASSHSQGRVRVLMETSASPSVAALQTFVGIDVSKAKLDVGCLPGGECRQFDNDPEGRKQLIEWLSSKSGCLLVVESTGGYERELVYAAQDAQLEIALCNPRQVPTLPGGSGNWPKPTPSMPTSWRCLPARAAAAASEHSGQAAGIGVAGGTASPIGGTAHRRAKPPGTSVGEVRAEEPAQECSAPLNAN